jgi:hypothetical protein
VKSNYFHLKLFYYLPGKFQFDITDMKRIIGKYHVSVASDIRRDGLGIELWLDHEMVAEVFRCDDDHTVIVNTFDKSAALSVFESFLSYARERLDPFQDGLPLPNTEKMVIEGVSLFTESANKLLYGDQD